MAAIDVIFCYAHEDEALLKQLKSHLSVLRREHLINVWHDRDIEAGAEWASEIDKHLNTAQLILLLISSNFMESEYCYGIEMKRAIDRHKRGEARVIPIILRPISWQRAPFGGLLALPTDGKPVKSSHWHNIDEAFFDIAEGIREAVENLQVNPVNSTSMSTRFQEIIAKGGSIQEALQDCNPDMNNLFQIILSTINGRCSKAVANGSSIKDALEDCYPGLGNLFQPMITFDRNNAASSLQAQIEKLLQEVSAVGDGDLRVAAQVTPDTLGVLADSFNYMIEELAKVVARVQSTAKQVTNATRRILDRSAQLAQTSETQISQISHMTSVIEALATFIQNVGHYAQQNADIAQKALHNTANGRQSMHKAIENIMLIQVNISDISKQIKRVGERSKEISEIIQIIEDITNQTNLLALNAAIQAAMLGEHGRGFTAVADEIRLLAERSTECTKRINTLITSIQADMYDVLVAIEDNIQELTKGSQSIDEADHALNSIYSIVERQPQVLDAIAKGINQQISVSKNVSSTMKRISEITHNTNAEVQETAVSVSYLADISEQLRASVSTFRLPEQTNTNSRFTDPFGEK